MMDKLSQNKWLQLQYLKQVLKNPKSSFNDDTYRKLLKLHFELLCFFCQQEKYQRLQKEKEILQHLKNNDSYPIKYCLDLCQEKRIMIP